MNIPWWGYVIFAGISWGTYVPIIFYGGQVLTPLKEDGTPASGVGGRLASILCVGMAYFVMAVVIPIVLLYLSDDPQPNWKRTSGLIFSGLAGVMGAIGAICVIFASKAATDEARGEFNSGKAELVAKAEAEPDPVRKAEMQEEIKTYETGRTKYLASYRIFIAPLIFCMAPFINTLLSLFWHPEVGKPFEFGFKMQTNELLMLIAGVALMAVGTFLVLYSKESAERNKKAPPKPGSAETARDLVKPN